VPPDFALKQGSEILAKLNNPEQNRDLVVRHAALLAGNVNSCWRPDLSWKRAFQAPHQFFKAEIRPGRKNK